MKAGDLVRINVEKLKRDGMMITKAELKNPFGFIIMGTMIRGVHCKSPSFRVILTETGEKFWYPKKFLEVIGE